MKASSLKSARHLFTTWNNPISHRQLIRATSSTQPAVWKTPPVFFIGEGTNIPGTPAPQSEVDLTGIIDQNRGNFRIHPRSTDDLTANPFSAPPSEQTLDVMTGNIEWFGDTSNGPSNVELQRQNRPPDCSGSRYGPHRPAGNCQPPAISAVNRRAGTL